MKKFKVLIISSQVPKIAFDILSTKYEVICGNGASSCPSPSRGEILTMVRGVDGILWSTDPHIQIDKEVLDVAGPQLKVISVMTAGVEYIDINEIKRRGISLGNIGNVSSGAVADMAILLALAVGRRVREAWDEMQTGKWEFSIGSFYGMEFRDSIVGIVGLGAIGLEIIKKLRGFEVGQFIYTGRTEKLPGRELGAKFVPFDELLERSDFIIVSCPYTSQTHEMFDAAAFAKMKRTAVFVNVARGRIVDQDALVAALEKGRIFGAGLDVVTPEPLPVGHKLFSLKNCVLAPHIGSATFRTRNDMAQMAANNIISAFENRQMPAPL